MKHRRFVTRLLNRPQMIEPGAGAAVVRALMPGSQVRAFGDDWSDGSDAPVQRDTREYHVTSTTAVIPIVGELVNRGGGMDAMSGVTSYAALQDMVADALADPTVDAILLDVDSPGGEALGCMDFAQWLRQQRGGKPIWASVNQQACSAAYVIVSGADRVVVGTDAMVGSCGVVAYHLDLSGQMKQDGEAVEWLYAGARKIDGVSTAPLTDPARAALQGLVDDLYLRLCTVVAGNRGISVQAVQATQAAVYRGADAVTAGLADEVATQEQTLMAMSNRRAAPGARLAAPTVVVATAAPFAPRASDTTQPPSAPDPATVPATLPPPANPDQGNQVPQRHELGDLTVEEADKQPKRNSPASPAPAQAVANACTKAGYPEMIAGLLAQGAALTDVRAAIEGADAIKAACTKVGLGHMAAGFIRNGLGLEAVQDILFEMRASADGSVRTDAGHSGVPAAAAGAKPMLAGPAVTAVYDSFNKALGGR